jgi:mandelate racemase
VPSHPLTIRGVQTRAVIAPLQRPIRTASGTIPGAPLLLLDIPTDAGVTGRAYVFGYTPLTLRPMAELVTALEETLVGRGVAPVARMRDAERAFRLLGRQGLLGMVLSGLDMALWDALGRVGDLPVTGLLGGEATPIPAYDSYGAIDPVGDRAALEQTLERGFRALKIKLGLGDLEADVAAVKAVRQIVGEKIRLMVDYNQSLTVAEAVRRIERLSEYDLDWIEEPVPAEDLTGHRQVRASSPVPIQTGENWWFPQDMARAIAAEACDFAMPDLMKIGGVTGWLRAAGQAEAASIPVSGHTFVEASAHVLAVTPTCHWLEYLDIAGAVLAEPAEVRDGTVTARGPGLGIAWNEAAVARYAV